MPQHTPAERAKNTAAGAVIPQAPVIPQAAPAVAPALAAQQVPVEGNSPLGAQGAPGAQGALPTPGNEAAAQAQIMEGLRNITVGNEEEGSAMIQQGFALLSPESQAAFLENLPPEQAAIVTQKTAQEGTGAPIEEFLFGAA